MKTELFCKTLYQSVTPHVHPLLGVKQRGFMMANSAIRAVLVFSKIS